MYFLRTRDGKILLNSFICLTRFMNTSFQASKPLQLAKSSSHNNHTNTSIRTTMAKDLSYFVVQQHTPVCCVNCGSAFKGLTSKQRLYTHFMSKACQVGGLISFIQCSPESPKILHFIYKLFSSPRTVESVCSSALSSGFSQDNLQAFLVFVGQFLSDSGNYKGFGDRKFIPGVDKNLLDKLISSMNDDQLSLSWSAVADVVYDLSDNRQSLGFWDKGVTTYHSRGVQQEDSDLINRFMKQQKLEPWNTRLFKTISDAKTLYEIRKASVLGGDVNDIQAFESSFVKITRGDYSPLLRCVNENLSEAAKYAANDIEKAMLDHYIKHFETGELDEHKDGSRQWIKNISPAVETYIGFIENYRDPAGARSEFEGFVTATDPKMSSVFKRLVDCADEILKKLTWGSAYEKDKFLKPDFTSIDVITFSGSGVPIGINIPNYDEIRQNEGFKNVSLGNIIAVMPKLKLPFYDDADEALVKKYHKEALDVQVALHELLGHGSGKLFIRSEDGTFNFDQESTKDGETGSQVKSWYEPGETYSSQFGALGSAYEECRAEAVGYFLCTFRDVLQIFDITDPEAQLNVMYANWLSEMSAGLKSLEYYNPHTKKWGQAHCYARYVLLRVALKDGNGFVTISEQKNADDGKPDLRVRVDKSRVETEGRASMGAFLKLLQTFKSTADVTRARALFDQYGAVDDIALGWRQIAIDRRLPRRHLLQPNTRLTTDGGDAELVEYEENHKGLIQSCIDRYSLEDINAVFQLSEADKKHFE